MNATVAMVSAKIGINPVKLLDVLRCVEWVEETQSFRWIEGTPYAEAAKRFDAASEQIAESD